jgi:exodeoxyribonuclease VIII
MSFRNAKVVSVGTDPKIYHAPQDAKRGSIKYVMSRSELIEFAACPAKWRLSPVKEKTKAMAAGSVLDYLLLCVNENFRRDYAVAPKTFEDGDPWNWARKESKAWKAAHSSVQIVDNDDYTAALFAADRMRTDPIIGQILRDSDYQVYVIADWVDEVTGVWVKCKAMLDVVPRILTTYDTFIFDLKRLSDASNERFDRQVYDNEWHIQAAFYTDIFNAANDHQRNCWGLIVSETAAPFQPARRIVDAEFVDLGRTKYREALALYCQCLATDKWPGYDDMESVNRIAPGFSTASLQPWMIKP